MGSPGRARIVIVGCGFGGLFAACVFIRHGSRLLTRAAPSSTLPRAAAPTPERRS